MDITTARSASGAPFRRSPLAVRTAGALLVSLLCAHSAFAQNTAPAAGVDVGSATNADSVLAPLAAGKFEWTPERSLTGPVVIVVSLPEQTANVYRGGLRIGRTSVSTGREGHETPPGVYNVLQKQKMHHSNKYNDAPMPFMQRLTWDGIALHAGHVTGHPGSHGCIRLPLAFAEILYGVTESGVTVVVADETTNGDSVLHPGDTVPVDAITGVEPGRDTPVASSVVANAEPAGASVRASMQPTVMASLAGTSGN